MEKDGATYVYPIGEGHDLDDALTLLGAKGWGLSRMRAAGLPVPFGFTITSEAGHHWLTEGRFPGPCERQIEAHLDALEIEAGVPLGGLLPPSDADAINPVPVPLCVSVRASTQAQTPGALDGILNVGLTSRTLRDLRDRWRMGAFADATWERFVRTFSHSTGVQPQAEDPRHQVHAAVGAVLESWRRPRATRHRTAHGLPEWPSTAVTVQVMVFGNLNGRSGAGMGFTRHPTTADATPHGEFRPGAQGGDIRPGAGGNWTLGRASRGASLEAEMPDTFAKLVDLCRALEALFRATQEVQFTVQNGVPFLLQTRPARRTPETAARFAVSLHREGLVTREEALDSVRAESLQQLMCEQLPDEGTLRNQGHPSVASGLAASPGAAVGHTVFRAEDAVKWRANGRDTVLVQGNSAPEDIHGMRSACGVLNASGGLTSHAAVMARGLGRCCIVGCEALRVNADERMATFDGTPHTVREGDLISIDGTRGHVYLGAMATTAITPQPELTEVLRWSDALRRLSVRCNADTAQAVRLGLQLGAEGVGLCRTEHMFFHPERLNPVRCAILAETPEARRHWTEQLLPMQREDFVELLRSVSGLPITVRLMDWPLHELLPASPEEESALADAVNVPEHRIRELMHKIREVNPMLGYRGARVGVARPDLYEVQCRALFEAAGQVMEEGMVVNLEVMVPMISSAQELARIKENVSSTHGAIGGPPIEYRLGCMVELPRACMVAHQLAEHAHFMSFGTNDLTQMTWGLSRDDAAKFLSAYVSGDRAVLESDPFAGLDVDGVGALVRLACERARSVRPAVELSWCGENGADPRTISFCEELRLNHISCPPSRLPTARLAAAQAAVRRKNEEISSQVG